ncbi:hypothetical protein D7Z26_16440 [Cohnella endophytica]|uniref:Uncharacterized protein n=1 Tax=Cohnella endophytica TaxID=2419778 RepID=A0A494XKZ1_9BACL|nr:hypothetical protein [Cohnella endophytica]RKP51385.1 hypothetical protein D7Z26_16440 [Cohnella endophytica]
MEQEKTLLDELTKEREGYVMRNPENGIEIKCTEEYVKVWEKRGFMIVGRGMFRLIEEEKDAERV